MASHTTVLSAHERLLMPYKTQRWQYTYKLTQQSTVMQQCFTAEAAAASSNSTMH
jgi:hypothetical protein